MSKLLKTAMAITGIALPLIANAAVAADLVVALPEKFPEQTKQLKSEMWEIFTSAVKRGDGYTVLNATTGEQVAHIQMGASPEFESIKHRIKKFGAENSGIAALLGGYKPGDGSAQINIPSVLRNFGDNRLNKDAVTDIIIVGSPVYISKDEPSFSWRDSKGIFQVPTTDHIFEPLSVSTYGTLGRELGLKNAFVHICALNTDEDWNSAYSEASHEFWSLTVQRLGGSLVTWTDNDLKACFKRFKLKARNVAKKFALQKSGKGLAMVKVSREGIQKLEPGTKRLNELTIDEFNIFVDENHRYLSGTKVVTGIKYQAEDYPQKFVDSWCYFNRTLNSAQIRIDVGRMNFGGKPNWKEPSKGTLNSAKISRTNVIAARESCQFPVSQ